MKKRYVIGIALLSAIGAWASYNKIKNGKFIGQSKKMVQEMFDSVEPTPYEPENPIDGQEWRRAYTI